VVSFLSAGMVGRVLFCLWVLLVIRLSGNWLTFAMGGMLTWDG